MRRDDTSNKTYFRSSERIFRMNELWYFASREGDKGPFLSERKARREVERFVVEQTELADFQHRRENRPAPVPGVLANVQSASLVLEDRALEKRAVAKRAAMNATAANKTEPPREIML